MPFQRTDRPVYDDYQPTGDEAIAVAGTGCATAPLRQMVAIIGRTGEHVRVGTGITETSMIEIRCMDGRTDGGMGEEDWKDVQIDRSIR